MTLEAGRKADASAPESDQNTSSPNLDALKLLQDLAPSLVKVATKPDKDGQWSIGTGFFVSSGDAKSCELVSLTHVTNGEKTINLSSNQGKSYTAELLRSDRKHELDLYKVTGLSPESGLCKPIPVSDRTPKQGEMVFSLSAATDPRWPEPLLGQTIGLVSRDNPVYVRRLSTMIGEDMLRPMLAFVLRGEHGDSGAPIVDAKGRLVGVESAAANGYSVAELSKFVEDLLTEQRAARNSETGDK